MVPNLPYFMVQFDYRGEKGYGHVIEGVGEADKAPEDEGGLDEGEKGGGEFPWWVMLPLLSLFLCFRLLLLLAPLSRFQTCPSSPFS
jgi:hypothetical protein